MRGTIVSIFFVGTLLIAACTREASLPVDSSPEKTVVNPTGLFAGIITPSPEPEKTEQGILGERYAFIVQSGSPTWLANIMHPEAGCNWMGVGGQVFDLQSFPVKNLVIEAGGSLEGGELSRVALTGSAPGYGEGGYEINLSGKPVASQQQLWIRVLDLEGKALSERVYFDTLEDCERNLILVNFVQSSTGETRYYFLPIVKK